MINKIIDELSDYSLSLVSPLLKAKVIARRLENKNLTDWIDKELNGYKEDDELPEYRIASAISNCDIQQGYNHLKDTPVPISLIQNKTLRSIFTDFHLNQSVSTLENLEKDPAGDRLGKPFPADFWAFVTREINKTGAKLQCRNIEVFTHKSSITQTLTEIRNKFLDIMLDFEKDFAGRDITQLESEEKRELSNQITIIMQQNNIKNTGSGSAINVGDDNQINSASGKNISQQNLSQPEKEQVEKLIQLIKEFHAENDFQDKDDSEFELERIEKQIKKENPNVNIIKSSLEVIKNFAIGIASSATAGPLVEGITDLMRNWA